MLLSRLFPFIKAKFNQKDTRVFVNSIWLFFDRILRIAISILVSAWMARFLGPERFGILNYAISLAALFGPIAELGLTSISLRNIVRAPYESPILLGTAFSMKAIGGILAGAAAFAAIFFVQENHEHFHILVLLVAASTIFQSFDVIEYWFQARVESKYVVCAKLSSFGVVTVIRIGLLITGGSLVAFAFAILLESFLNALALLVVYSWRKEHIRLWRSSVATAKSLLKDSAPLILSGFMKILFLRIDQVMLANMAGTAELGIYSVAVKLSEGFFFLPVILYSSMFPGIVEARESSEKQFFRKLQKLYDMNALLGYILIVGFTFFSQQIISFLYGKEFLGAAPMLMVLAWSLLFVNLGTGRGAFLISMNWTKVHLFTMAGGTLVNIFFNSLLIPRIGGMGAAIASVAAYGFAGYFSCFFFRPLFKTGAMLTKSIILPKVWR